MKRVSIAGACILALCAAQAFAAEGDNAEPEAAVEQESELYLNEIRTTCEAEAEGLPDAEEYVRNCINMMKQEFSASQQ